MSIGPAELSLLAFLVVIGLLLTAFLRQAGPWLLGIVTCFAIAMVVTPADPVSMRSVAVPYSVIVSFYALRMLRPA